MVVSWDEHYATEAGYRMWPNEELVRWISGRKFERALDVGAGTGSNLRLLNEHADCVVALEPNETARGHLRNVKEIEDDQYGDGDSITIVDGDLRSLDEEDDSFDLVVDCMTSQHLKWAEHQAVYEEYARVLKPGGWMWLYHLNSETRCAIKLREPELERAIREENRLAVPRASRLWPFDYYELSLFPTVGCFCMPTMYDLAICLEMAGFEQPTDVRKLQRAYPNGDIASYAILAARKEGEK